MHHPATYRKFADACRLMAETATEQDRRLLLDHADAWTRLAEQAEREGAVRKPPSD